MAEAQAGQAAPGTEIARIDEQLAAQLAGMVDKNDATGVSIPSLKINYVTQEEGAKFPKGTWVVGQQKDKEGNILEQGKEVKAVVILAVRNRYSYYHRKDTSLNCSSPLHVQGEQVKGNKYKNVCGPTCPYRAKELNPRCKAQKVILGVALTADGEAIDCMAYMQGQTYVPFVDYYKTLTKRKVKAGFVDIPPFCHPTLLGVEKLKYDATVYFKGVFTAGPMFTMEQIKGFEARRDMARAAVDRLNQLYATDPETEPAAEEVATGSRLDEAAVAAPPAGAPVEVDVTPAPTGADYDIEAAIRSALGK